MKWTQDELAQARSAGMAACELAVEYGVSTKTIHLMRRGLRYSDV